MTLFKTSAMPGRPGTSLARRGIVAAAIALAFQAVPAHASTSILFIGNSFTYGALTPAVQNYKVTSVSDLNFLNGVDNGVGTRIGGVPALFKQMTVDAGLDYTVSLETYPGSNLDLHYNDAAHKALIDQSWDKVVMHGQSNLDFGAPNNPAKISQYTGLLGAMFQARNPAVDISLTATWSRADLTYPQGAGCATSPWCNQPITQMALDVQAGYFVAQSQNASIVSRINPVGLSWNNAINAGFADPNPYDGIDPGKVNLWASDSYHASIYGYYLHALVVFGEETGRDPMSLGYDTVARDLGMTADQASALQGFASSAISAVPEPSQWLMLAMGGGVIGWLARRRREIQAEAT